MRAQAFVDQFAGAPQLRRPAAAVPPPAHRGKPATRPRARPRQGRPAPRRSRRRRPEARAARAPSSALARTTPWCRPIASPPREPLRSRTAASSTMPAAASPTTARPSGAASTTRWPAGQPARTPRRASANSGAAAPARAASSSASRAAQEQHARRHRLRAGAGRHPRRGLACLRAIFASPAVWRKRPAWRFRRRGWSAPRWPRPAPSKRFSRGPFAARRGRAELHGQADALAHRVDLQHLHLDDVAGLHHLAGIVDELVRQLAHVHQAVLVHAQVDEGAEGGDVAHRAFQLHAGLQVGDVVDALVEARHLEVRPRIAARLLQLAQDVLDRDDAELLVGEQLRLEAS